MTRLTSCLLVASCVSLTACGCGGVPPASAAPLSASSAIRRTLIERAPAHETGFETRLYLIEYPPGASAPAHDHPAAGIGWVVDGEFESEFDGEPRVRVQAGHGFVDPANVSHRVFRNVSTERPLRFVIAYTIRVDEEAVRPLNPR